MFLAKMVLPTAKNTYPNCAFFAKIRFGALESLFKAKTMFLDILALKILEKAVDCVLKVFNQFYKLRTFNLYTRYMF